MGDKNRLMLMCGMLMIMVVCFDSIAQGVPAWVLRKAPGAPQMPGPPPASTVQNTAAPVSASNGSSKASSGWQSYNRVGSGAGSSSGSSGVSGSGVGIIRMVLHRDGGKPSSTRAKVSNTAYMPDATASSGSGDYVIKRDDTLWDLAHQFLGNPFEWRQIWQQNQYIQNPDLIYPGNRLLVAGFKAAGYTAATETAAASAIATPVSYSPSSQAFTNATAGFLDNSQPPDFAAAHNANAASSATADIISEPDFSDYQPLIQEKVLTPEFLAQVPFLWMKKDERGLVCPGDARIDPTSERKSFQQFDEITIKVFGSGSYAIGDTVDIYRSIRMVTFNKQEANLVSRIAKARVTGVKGKTLTASLYKIGDMVKPGDRVAHAEKFEKLTVGAFVDPPAQVRASVFQRVQDSPMPYPFQTFIIDRGVNDGVQRGDLFFVFPTSATDPVSKPCLLACAAYTGERFSTLTIVKQFTDSLGVGYSAAMVKRVQYN